MPKKVPSRKATATPKLDARQRGFLDDIERVPVNRSYTQDDAVEFMRRARAGELAG